MQLGEPAQVLGHGSQREFELSSARSTQPKAADPQDSFQVSEQHLNALAVATGLFKGLGAGERTGNIAGLFMNAAGDLAGRLFGAASHLVRARVAIRFARPVQHLIIYSRSYRSW